MGNSLQIAHQWWAALGQTNRQRVWDARYRYLDGDLVEKWAAGPEIGGRTPGINGGAPVMRCGWSMGRIRW